MHSIWAEGFAEARLLCAFCGADVMLSGGNATRDQSKDGSGFGLASIYYRQYMEMEFWSSGGNWMVIMLALLWVLLLSLKYNLAASLSLSCVGTHWEGTFSDTSSCISISKLETLSSEAKEKQNLKVFSMRLVFVSPIPICKLARIHSGALILHYCGFFRGL